ncbi:MULTISPECIES: hypothetical protein [unclassified Streptomyces]|uniref:hypothetical protein n=1 Tax=unclassified Streptomyces TaxID=2593676 RepID=UPI001F38BA5A|nr:MULTISPECIES: hypothetical protein [unclassified Streptomyces]MCF0086645.1 hypothetical protein [Streptomyces sp. MH192]MCF0098799.1 hypothetical protein [Streptomyces sp. MH191]
MTARTARKHPRKTNPAKKQQPAKTPTRLSLVKTVPARPMLPARDRDFLTAPQCHAALAAATTGIPTLRIRDWRDHRDNTTSRRLPDGSLLHYSHDAHTLTWHTTCPMGAVHAYTISSPSTAAAARVHAARCTRPHHDLTTVPPLSPDELAELGLLHTPTWAHALPGEPPTETKVVPLPDRADRALADTLTHSPHGTADTQPLPAHEIAAHITATNDTAKEHPQP